MNENLPDSFLDLFTGNYDSEEIVETANLKDIFESNDSSLCKDEKEISVNENLDKSIGDAIDEPSPKKKRCIETQELKNYEVRFILQSHASVLKFCQEIGLMATSVTCCCGEPMNLRKDGQTKVWRCTNLKNHSRRYSHSMRKGTIFQNCSLPISEILWLAYMWIHDYSYNSIQHECNTSPASCLERFSVFRDTCKKIIESKTEPVGGSGKLVEIFTYDSNETEDQWVFCALQHFSFKTIISKNLDNKTTVIELFEKCILPGSTIFSEEWNGFHNLSRGEFYYLKNEMSIRFYNINTKLSIEDYNAMKKLIKSARPRYKYDTKFCEQIYRKTLKYSTDAYITFLQDISKVHPPVTKHIPANQGKHN